jgi:hypothetical protein
VGLLFSRTLLQRGGYGLAIVLVAGAGLAASACGGGSAEGAQVASLGNGSTQSTTTSTGATSDDPQEILLSYTKCMRKEGIDLPDPDFSGGPRGGFRVTLGAAADRDDPKFQAAQKKCEPILRSLRQQFDPERQEQFQEAALKFAKCMREHGIDMPDPDFSGGQPGGRGGSGGPFGGAGVDRDDPKFQAAEKACQSAFDGLGGPGGGPRLGSTRGGGGTQ